MQNWGVYILAALGFGVYGGVMAADRDSTGAIVGDGTVAAYQVRVGDCFDDSTSDAAGEITSLPGVPCSEEHDNEAFAVIEFTLPSYPGGDTMDGLAYTSCMERFEAFVGKDYESSSLDVMTMYPSPESWNQKDREIVCAVYDMEANKLVGSVQGRAL